MSKLSYEEKIKIYNKRKEGETLKTLQSKYGITKHNIQYLVWLINKHKFDILRTNKNKEYLIILSLIQVYYYSSSFSHLP